MAPRLQVGATVSEVAGANHINTVVQLSNTLRSQVCFQPDFREGMHCQGRRWGGSDMYESNTNPDRLPFFENGAKHGSGFEMCFAIRSQHLGVLGAKHVSNQHNEVEPLF